MKRRNFLRTSMLTTVSLWTGQAFSQGVRNHRPARAVRNQPVVISTWPNVKANASAWKTLSSGGSALDAVEAGVRIPEADPEDQSVGYGGLPDRDGRVTLDACIMDAQGSCGAVMALEHIMHPISVARLVMEKTPHVQLAGEGALQFALTQGFKKENLLTAESEAKWRAWMKESRYDPMDTMNNMNFRMQGADSTQHDTIGMLALDAAGNLSGACTTSGMAYKMHGRVGDSPIIGAGLFVDNEVGAAAATGVGEEVVRVCGSHLVVELMRQGYSPEEACKAAVARIVKRNGSKAGNLQVGFIALNRQGVYGAYSVIEGFSYAVHNKLGAAVKDAKRAIS
jgi:N4-(beta-N-acetylglucosaminyl)-L-asparaginase